MVIDTMIFAYALLGVDEFREDSLEFFYCELTARLSTA